MIRLCGDYSVLWSRPMVATAAVTGTTVLWRLAVMTVMTAMVLRGLAVTAGTGFRGVSLVVAASMTVAAGFRRTISTAMTVAAGFCRTILGVLERS